MSVSDVIMSSGGGSWPIFGDLQTHSWWTNVLSDCLIERHGSAEAALIRLQPGSAGAIVPGSPPIRRSGLVARTATGAQRHHH